MALPCALFSSSSNCYKPDEFVKKILNLSELPQPQVFSDSIHGYDWAFETKYYTATINLCTTDERTIGSQEFADNLQAFVHFFDPNEPESFELTKAWLPYLEHIEPTIQILVCDTSRHTDVINRKKALEWCIAHGFELVELNPEEEEDDTDNEDDFLETTGMARIIQALHAHTWPNLEMKDNPNIQSPYVRQLMKEQHLLNQQEAASSEEISTDPENCLPCEAEAPRDSVSKEIEKSESLESDAGSDKCESNSNMNGTHEATSADSKEEGFQLDNVDWNALMATDTNHTGGDSDDQELGVEEFELLFQKLKVMKDKAETLPLEDRKKYAEKIVQDPEQSDVDEEVCKSAIKKVQVAVSFWKAIGGDEDEIAGIGDEDSD